MLIFENNYIYLLIMFILLNLFFTFYKTNLMVVIVISYIMTIITYLTYIYIQHKFNNRSTRKKLLNNSLYDII